MGFNSAFKGLKHITTDHKEGKHLQERRNVGESSCNSGDGNGSKGPILDVDDDDDDDDDVNTFCLNQT